ncbi:hypothetical protein [Escherichia coli]|uniref:hypothetical protein n=1 Tax=Escherichia coli TaxID=562 RepID=UPI00201CF569|nr:hypothetical protein [Escherichia coli]
METAPVQYAIVDGAVEEGLLDFLQEKKSSTLLLISAACTTRFRGVGSLAGGSNTGSNHVAGYERDAVGDICLLIQ